MITSTIEQYILENQLLADKSKVIVAVSGGADSVALLDILHTLGYECIVAHCNFHLRGEESNRDAKFVKDICEQYHIEFNCIDFDTEVYAKEKSISIEMAARELRYTWFEKLRISKNVDAIAVAHHKDDSVETVLLNLIRGTGIKGLTGISPQNGHIIRPLLPISRKDVMAYIEAHHLSFITDSTNTENIYTRNKIRLDILPLIETINPSVKDSIYKTSKHLLQAERIYSQYIETAKCNIIDNNGINIEKLLQQQEPEAILFEILSEYSFNADTIENILHSLNGIAGKIFLSPTHQVLKDRDYLIVRKNDTIISSNTRYEINEDDNAISHPIPLKIEFIKLTEKFRIEKNKNILYLDKVSFTYPLTIRKWQQGDWFIPFGMKGKKKVSDFFSDQKFNLFDKENTWLLCSGDNIIWIIGHRADNRYKITPSTDEVIKISVM